VKIYSNLKHPQYLYNNFNITTNVTFINSLR